MSSDIQRILYGKYPLENIVSCEVSGTQVELFIQNPDDTVTSVVRPFKPWMLAPKSHDSRWSRLDGDLHYKFIRLFDDVDSFMAARKMKYQYDLTVVNNLKEQAMIFYGFTYFKGMTPKQVGVLSFDIETTSLAHDKTAKVLMITNTFRVGDKITRRLFSFDDYGSCGEMIQDWAKWVRDIDPSLLIGHNVFSFDLPYMIYCAERTGHTLDLGRDGSAIQVPKYVSKFRKDQQQSYDYKALLVYGREIVDTFFLSLRYDMVAKKYDNYRLKHIIAVEKLEKTDRAFYDASKIRENYTNPEEMKKIKAYAIDDADDALALYDLMIPANFYSAQMIPKSYQQIMLSATGSQINSMLVRSYLQDGHSIPKADDRGPFQGAISYGQPGVYKNAIKWDVASLYPSIIVTYGIESKKKDPKGHFLAMVKELTARRLVDKKLAKETGDRKYDDSANAMKLFVNSAYGFLGASGLNFNYPDGAAQITTHGRDILKQAIFWATSENFKHEVEYIKEEADE